jgi:hypothetical protein
MPFALAEVAELIVYLKSGHGFFIADHILEDLLPGAPGDGSLDERCARWASKHGAVVRRRPCQRELEFRRQACVPIR